MFEGVDTVVLHNELAFHAELPLQWVPVTRKFDLVTLDTLDHANVELLQSWIALEEQPSRDKAEDLGPLAHEMARLDHKINLVLQLLGTLVGDSAPATIRSVHFNALGASWREPGTRPSINEQGTLRLRLPGLVPRCLEFPAQVSGVDADSVSVKYLQLTELSAELIQRLCFMKHRKDVAGARKSRSG